MGVWVNSIRTSRDASIEIITTEQGKFAIYIADYITVEDLNWVKQQIESEDFEVQRFVFLKEAMEKYVYFSSNKKTPYKYDQYIDDCYVVAKLV